MIDLLPGPYLVTTDEIENPNDLNMWLKVNGETMQSSNLPIYTTRFPFFLLCESIHDPPTRRYNFTVRLPVWNE